MSAPARTSFGLFVGSRQKAADSKPDGCSSDCTCKSCPECSAPCEHCSEGCPKRTAGEAAKAAPADDRPKAKVFKFRANDGDFDRYQDRLNVQGWKLDAFNANPVILLNHDTGAPSWCSPGSGVLPIGKGKAYPEQQKDGSWALMVDIEFDQDDELAQRVEKKVEAGILNAVSVRYIMTEGKYRENERGGYDSDEQELLEISVVTIPGNQRAVRAKDARTTPQVGELLDAVKALTLALGRHSDLMEKSFAPADPAAPVTAPTPAEPKTSEVPAPAPLDTVAVAKAIAPAVLKSLKEITR